MVEITEEMRAAAKAGFARAYNKKLGLTDDEVVDAVLSATLPLIEAAVREDIAKSEIWEIRRSIRQGARRSDHRFKLPSARDSGHE